MTTSNLVPASAKPSAATASATATAGEILVRFANSIDTQDWEALGALLEPEFEATYVHTGETFDRDGFVALNRDYPGSWRFEHQQVVDGGDVGALRARVSDATGESDEVHHVATFARVRGGLVTELTEVWAEVSTPDPSRR
ncbi:SnoaL-like protein [Knoellia remsis]|uniref:SnoaL-like protein n=1 Tax=Knoellia remsis TaxID=407159 RepID=A0A2T0UXQ2_9MICO|nr:nuclear transport factor 2 family protein [Knoellia remsis]PRY62627.1 SnoaL-like protein [Knoellia remsis]